MSEIVGVTDKGIGFYSLFKKFFTKGLIILFFIIIFYSAIKHSIEDRSLMPLAVEVGQRFFLSISALNTESEAILAKGAIETQGNLLNIIWNTYLKWDGFLAALIIIFFWLKILVKILGNSFLSTEADTFRNWILALGIFITINYIFAFSFYAVEGQITSYYTGEHSARAILAMPFTALANLFKVLTLILDPLSQRIGNY